MQQRAAKLPVKTSRKKKSARVATQLGKHSQRRLGAEAQALRHSLFHKHSSHTAWLIRVLEARGESEAGAGPWRRYRGSRCPFAVPLLPLGASGVGMPRGAQKRFQLLLGVMCAAALSSCVNVWQQMRFMHFMSQTKLLVDVALLNVKTKKRICLTDNMFFGLVTAK